MAKVLAHLAAEFLHFFDQFWSYFRPYYRPYFRTLQNRPSFGLPYRNENVPEIPNRYFRVSGPIFVKIHRTSKMLPVRIALVKFIYGSYL